jgi:uncharacterized protein YbaR (Trm112 family)
VTLTKDFLDILACPRCKGPLEPREADRLLCAKCRLAFAVKDGIPVLLLDEAKPY